MPNLNPMRWEKTPRVRGAQLIALLLSSCLVQLLCFTQTRAVDMEERFTGMRKFHVLPMPEKEASVSQSDYVCSPQQCLFAPPINS